MALDAMLPAAAAVLPLVGAYWLAFRVVNGSRTLATALVSFMVFQGVFLVGLYAAIDWNQPFDQRFAVTTAAAMVAVVAGAIAANSVLGFRPRREIGEYKQRSVLDDIAGSRMPVVLMVGIVGVLVAVYFLRSVGFNSFRVAFDAFLSGGEVDRGEFVELRKSIPRNTYLAVGYVAQITSVILPAIAYVVYLKGRLFGRRAGLQAAAVGFIVVAAYSVSAAGGRGFVLQIFVAFLILISHRFGPLARSDQPPARTIRLVGVILVSVYVLTTALQGRVDAGDTAIDSATNAVASAYNRVSGEYSENQLVAIRELRKEAPVWGSEWWETAKIALPGPSSYDEISFERRVHGIIHEGNTRGNAPLALWTSTHYNWGPLGTVVIGLVLGFALQAFSVQLLIRRPKTLLHVCLVSVAGYRLALFRDPYSLLLEGAPTLLLLLWVLRTVAADGPVREPASAR